MSSRRAIAVLLMCAALAGGALAAQDRVATRRQSTATAWPAGDGHDIAEKACGICHSAMLVTQQAKDSTGWEKTLAQMEKWGAPLAPGEHAPLAGYLRTHFGVANRK